MDDDCEKSYNNEFIRNQTTVMISKSFRSDLFKLYLN